MSRFLILGATGPSGVLLVRKTLELYPSSSIVIYARSPNKVPEDLKNHASITIVQGTLTQLDVVETALEGVDVILSALGPISNDPSTPISTFYDHLIDLMHKHNIKRFIFLGTASSPDPNDKFSWKYASLVRTIKTFFYHGYRDIVGMGKVIREKGNDLDWTMVRVPILTNADSEAVAVGYVGDPQVGVMLARKAYAAFSVEEVEKRAWLKTAPMISNP